MCASESPENVVFRFFSRLSSCYGTVSSLNGEPEQGVAVEAAGQSDCSIYGEDTVTDEEGKFRLRGLLVSLWMCFVSGFFHTGFSGAWVQWCPQDARNGPLSAGISAWGTCLERAGGQGHVCRLSEGSPGHHKYFKIIFVSAAWCPCERETAPAPRGKGSPRI